MNSTKLENNLAIGIWKFIEVEPAILVQLAEEWRDGPEGERYEALYVRKASRTQWGLGFSYRLPEGERNHTPYFERTSDGLKRRFGNQLAGWDVSSGNIWTIK